MALDLKQTKILRNEPLSKYTSWRVGGPARYLNIVETPEGLKESLLFAGKNKLKTLVIGAGTNLLVSDKGFDGVVIKLGGTFGDVEIVGEKVTAGAAVSLSNLARISVRQGFRGLEFAVGIPGSLGGALTMNAGAYGGSVGDVIDKVAIYTPNEELKILSKEDIDFGYRTSSLRDAGIITSATMGFKKADPEELRIDADEAMEQRKKCQPAEGRTAGSVFKNPEGEKAGVLIEETGLKGIRVGGAAVSEKHANFIINEGNATAKDIKGLMDLVKKKVRERTGITLQEEVCLVGEF